MRQAVWLGFRVLGVGLLTGILILGGPCLAKPKAHPAKVVAKATQLAPPRGGFSVTLPAGFGNVQKRTVSILLPSGAAPLITFMAGSPNRGVSISYSDYPMSLFEGKDIPTILKDSQRGTLAMIHGTLQTEKSMQWFGYPGRMFEFYTPAERGKKKYWRRLHIVATPRLFQVSCFSLNPSDLNHPSLRQFLDSFRVSKAKF